MFGIWQQLFLVTAVGIRGSRQKARHLFPVLGRKDRAGCVEQFTARTQERPQGIDDPRLRQGKTGDILDPAQPLGIWIAPNDAAGGARHIRQNRVEMAAIPPLAGFGAIGSFDACRQTEALQVFLNTPTTCRLQIKCEQIKIAAKKVVKFKAGADLSNTVK